MTPTTPQSDPEVWPPAPRTDASPDVTEPTPDAAPLEPAVRPMDRRWLVGPYILVALGFGVPFKYFSTDLHGWVIGVLFYGIPLSTGFILSSLARSLRLTPNSTFGHFCALTLETIVTTWLSLGLSGLGWLSSSFSGAGSPLESLVILAMTGLVFLPVLMLVGMGIQVIVNAGVKAVRDVIKSTAPD